MKIYFPFYNKSIFWNVTFFLYVKCGYSTFSLFASNRNRKGNLLRDRRENTPTYLFCTHLYRHVFTCFNFVSVRPAPKNKLSISCTFFFFNMSCISCWSNIKTSSLQWGDFPLALDGPATFPPPSHHPPRFTGRLPHLPTPRPHQFILGRQVSAALLHRLVVMPQNCTFPALPLPATDMGHHLMN